MAVSHQGGAHKTANSKEGQVATLLQDLRSCNPHLRLQARQGLIKQPVKALTQHLGQLTPLLLAHDPRARCTALALLQRLPSAIVCPLLPQVLPALEDGDADVQRAALELLRRVTPNAFSRYGDRIASLLDDSNKMHARVTALYATALLPEDFVLKACLDRIMSCLRCAEVNVRWAALDVVKERPALAAARPEEIIERLSDSDRFVRWMAMSTLCKVPRQALEPKMECLTSKLSSAEGFARGAAVMAICRLDSELVEAQLPAVMQRLADEHAAIRWATVHSLSKLPSAMLLKYLNLIKEGLTDEDRWVRRGAANLLHAMPAESIEPALKELAEEVLLETEDVESQDEFEFGLPIAMEDVH